MLPIMWVLSPLCVVFFLLSSFPSVPESDGNPACFQTGLGVLSEDCVEVTMRIYNTVDSSWASVRRCLLSCDPARAGCVHLQNFRKVLWSFSVNLSEEEFFQQKV
ncbi:uncharacterized protein ACO6RY_14977 [Pungitius sinensis]